MREQKIVVRNVACVDLRTTGEEVLQSISRIENVATLLYSPRNAETVTRLNVLNVASMLEAPADAQIIAGQEVLRHGFGQHMEKPLDAVVVGQLMVMPDVVADEVRAGIEKLVIAGQILYPDHVGSAIRGKLAHVSGQAIAYAGGSRLTVGKLNLTKSYLEALDDNSALMVIGALSARTILPTELIERKIREIQILGALTCREENSAALLNRVNDSMGHVHTTVIPAGFEPVDGWLNLDASLLDVLPARQLYCRDVRIAEDVDSEQLDEALDALQVSHLLIAPSHIRSVLSRKCNLIGTNSVLYSGALWLFEDEDTLYPQRFEFVEGNVTIVVTGELTVASDVDPAILMQRVEKIHNFGEIFCTPAQMSALQNRMGLRHGEFIESGTSQDEGNVIGNTAYLRL